MPESVAIVAMGRSLEHYVRSCLCNGGKMDGIDEVWAVNAVAGMLTCDKAFVIDPIGEFCFEKDKFANYLKWFRTITVPVLTSEPHPLAPTSVRYPLEEVRADLGPVPFVTTVSYAIAYAIHTGVKKLFLFGCDFSYPDAMMAESGHLNAAYFLGIARGRGMEVVITPESTLMEYNRYHPATVNYGFHSVGKFTQFADAMLDEIQGSPHD